MDFGLNIKTQKTRGVAVGLTADSIINSIKEEIAMRKGLSLIASAVVMAVSGSSAFAAHPAFDGFQVSGGAIDVNNIDGCGTTHTCEAVAGGEAGSGFLQYMATDTASGESYIGTIVTDANADNTTNPKLGFVDQSFVRMEMCGNNTCNTNGGISSKQSIYEEGTDGTTFASNVSIATGSNFAVAGTPSITIAQSLLNTAASTTTKAGDDFMSDFYYEATNDSNGVRTGFIMQIDQVAGLESANDPDGLTAGDVQSFTYREAAGDAVTGVASGAQLNIPGVTAGVGYTNGDDIKAVWLGQDVGSAGAFSYLSYENKSTPAVISSFDLTSSDGPGTAWDPVFNLSFSGNHPLDVDASGNPIAIGGTGTPTLANPSGR